jgi:hypothetical protein
MATKTGARGPHALEVAPDRLAHACKGLEAKRASLLPTRGSLRHCKVSYLPCRSRTVPYRIKDPVQLLGGIDWTGEFSARDTVARFEKEPRFGAVPFLPDRGSRAAGMKREGPGAQGLKSPPRWVPLPCPFIKDAHVSAGVAHLLHK